MATEIRFTELPLDQSDVRYAHGPHSSPQDGVPSGTTTQLVWDRSAVFPGTSRTLWVHVPAGYDPSEPASLVVFQDGAYFADPAEEVRATVVLDNLVHRGDLPMTIGVFVEPGADEDADAPRQRNVEYDAFDDRYATLLLEEILPEVATRWPITDDPERRAICGFSSGGNAAFTAAWLRPDAFGRVISCSASFAQIPGGNPYPGLVPHTARKPLRVLLQVRHRDLGWDEPEGNWLAENLRVAAALAEAAYDVRLVIGEGGHDPNHAGVLLPDALRWVFGS